MELLLEEGLVHLQDYFLNGTKIESKANKYTFVWKKGMDKNRDLEELGEYPISSEKIENLAK